MEATAAANKDARLIMSMTGMDAFIALLLAVEIDGIGKFASADKLVSWAGMCPTVHQSGDNLYHDKIKKLNVNRLVKWTVVQAAWAAVGSIVPEVSSCRFFSKTVAQDKCKGKKLFSGTIAIQDCPNIMRMQKEGMVAIRKSQLHTWPTRCLR